MLKKELFPHQTKAIEELDNGKILVGDVGTGKSLTAAFYYATKECGEGRKPNVYVITTAKKRDSQDWEREFLQVGVTSEETNPNLGVLKVDSWNNIGKYVDVKDAFFIFDEQRLVGSGQWTKSFYKIAKANRWILLSATPGDTWLDYIPVFVANGFYKNKSEFIREHVVYARFVKFPKVERYMATGRLVRQRNGLLVEMPMVRHTERRVAWKTVEHDRDLVDQATKNRWNMFENAPMKDVAELFRVVRKIVNSDDSRIETIRRLMLVHPRLIIFYNFDYELEKLRDLVDGDENVGVDKETVMAEWNGHRHDAVPKGAKWIYLVQYTAGSEGWNCVTTDAMVFYSLTYSYKQWHQSFGRIDRLNTRYKTLYYYVLCSNAWIDLAIKKSLKAKRSFNEASFSTNLVQK